MTKPQSPPDVSVAIIGGGIGGLTAAVSLLQAGFDVRVYEQARWLSEVGAGINIGPNAARLLIKLGCATNWTRWPSVRRTFTNAAGRTAARSPAFPSVKPSRLRLAHRT
jgi:salicylate hydroxylase